MHSPFANDTAGRVASVGEIELLRLIRSWLGDCAPPSPEGMGDDTAVLPGGAGNLLTSDSLVFGRHFDADLEPALAGAKLLKRNLSDIAAMGGRPGAAVMAAFLPPPTSLRWLEAFTRGLADCARTWGVPIVGGDLTESIDFLGFNLTLTGQAARPLLRTGAQVGDEIWVSGELGGSLAGHHATFTPRLPEGAWLAQEDAVRSLIDVTDGLAKDLPALLPPGTSAALALDAAPIRAAAYELARSSGRTVLDHAFADGEDYELLFTASPRWRREGGPERWSSSFDTPLACLGTVIVASATKPAPLVDGATGQPLKFSSGYAHFG